MMSAPSLSSLAQALGGEVAGRTILAPGPGHSSQDRSLSIEIREDAPDGFLVHSFAGDDPIACKDYVRDKAGLPAWRPGESAPKAINGAAAPRSRIVAEYFYRQAD